MHAGYGLCSVNGLNDKQRSKTASFMYLSILSFVVATIIIGHLPVLPDSRWFILMALVCLAGLRFQRLRILCSFLLGIAFAVSVAENSLSARLPVELEAKDILVIGYVSSLPKIRNKGIKFLFEIVESENQVFLGRVSLNWYSEKLADLPRAGEKWQLLVRMVRPHGLVNSNLFDYEGWLFAQGILATGYVREEKRNRLLRDVTGRALHHQVREKIRSRVSSRLPDDAYRGLLLALLIGESGQIDKASWRVLSATGTNHLLIVSGLHVGLVASLLLFFWQWVLRRITEHWRVLAGVLAFILTLFYGAIAGFGLPVQRALAMVAIGLVGLTMERNISVAEMLLYALLFVTLLNPFAALSAGYWLSFGAVGSLIFAFAGRRDDVTGPLHRLTLLMRTQWVVFVAMAPLLLCWVMQVSLLSFFVNLIAIPIIALIIVPLLLVAQPMLLAGCPPGFWLLDIVYILLEWFFSFLQIFADLDWVFRRSGIDIETILLACCGSLIFLLPRGLLPKWLGILMFLPILMPIKTDPEAGDLVVQVLDTGQGLSVIIRTQSHVVVYDAGPAYGSRFDAGEQIVVPSIRMQGMTRIHTLVVSHSDIDHAGGVPALEKHLKILRKISSFDASGSLCRSGQSWRLEVVRFSILLGSIDASENNQSCVLLVQVGDFSMLLPGDIEAEAEMILLDQELPPINVMLAPHHGSRSSSSPAFLNHVKPELVIVSAGYRNRFKHPHPRVIARYRARGIEVLNTAESGAITIRVGSRVTVQTARISGRRFWYD